MRVVAEEGTLTMQNQQGSPSQEMHRARARLFLDKCREQLLESQRDKWPPKFCPNLTEKYDSCVNPSEFLQIYTMIIEAAGGDDRPPRKEKATDSKPSATTPGESRSADKWCSMHNTYRDSLADCRTVKNLAVRYRKTDEERQQSRREGKAPTTSAGNRQGDAKKKAPADDDDDSEDLEFKEPQQTVATLDGGACAQVSCRSFKAMRRALLAAVPTHEAARRARWSEEAGPRGLPDRLQRQVETRLDRRGASLNIISPAAFHALKAPGMKLQPSLPIIGVTPGNTWLLGHIELPVTFGDPTNFCTERIDFDVANLNLPYNAVLGRPALVKFMAATHYAYPQIKMSGPNGPITISSDVKIALACAEQRADRKHARLLPAGKLRHLRLEAVGHAWGPQGGDRAPPRRAVGCVTHLAEDTAPSPGATSLHPRGDAAPGGRLHPRGHLPRVAGEPVVIPKANGKLRMCIDYTDLNKACPKDPFPLLRIDQIVDSTMGCNLLCFLDAYSVYHQIRMAWEDEEKTASITPVGTFCYTTMPFGLKNAGPTSQRMTRITLSNQIRHNVEAYVDDLVVKTRQKDTLLQDLAETFDSLRSTRMKQNPERRDNAVADELSRIASARAPLPPGVFEESLMQPSARSDPPRVLNATTPTSMPSEPQASGPEGVNPDPTRQIAWMADIRAYLDNHTLPEDRAEAKKLARISKRYVLVEGTLYRRDANGVLLKCIPRKQGVELIADAHEGECRAYSASRILVVWGLDILGPFKAARGGYQHLYIAIDKFTKWPEAYPVIKINKHSALKFIRGITSRFRVPNRIITDNGTQFTSLKTKTYNVLKKHGDSWLEELPVVLWANWTTPSRATRETPFFLVYGVEAVLPLELSLGSPRVALYNEADQDELRRDDLDYLEERRRRTALRTVHYQQSLQRYHQRHVWARSLQVHDLFLRRV
uniref:Putative gag-pol n=1 Tax=Oryza sativa subsp. japonica TaxID=39947 RepID=Q6UUT3_ORYSJ|nr:putative gag-pol precursor [Oryza sativa Japonica Group]